MRNYIIEFIGTFFLVLTIALTGNPIAIGAVLIAMVYMGGYISGAHYNPAVTLAVFLRGLIGPVPALLYMFFQILGALAAAAVYSMVKGTVFVPAVAAGVSVTNATLLEALYTFALASVVLHVATATKTKDNNYYGLAIGLTVMAAAFAAGPLSGGAFNPAVGVGPILFDYTKLSAHTTDLAIYIGGPLLGGALAGLIFKLVGEENKS